MWKKALARLPPTDRITFAHELPAAVLYGVFSGLALPLLPIVARTIGVSPAGITAMLTMQFVGALFGVALGHLADRAGTMALVTWPNVASRSMLLLFAFVRGPAGFAVVASLHYLFSSCSGPAYSAVMRTNYGEADRGRLMGTIRIVISVSAAVCSSFAGSLLRLGEDSYRWLFPAAGMIGIASALVFGRVKARRLPETAAGPSRATFLESMRALRRGVPYLAFMAVFFVATTPDKLAVPLEPIRFVDELHVDYVGAGIILGTVVSACSVAGYLLWPRALKRWNSFTLLALVVFLIAGRYLVIAFAGSQNWLIPASVMAGLAWSGWDLIPLFCVIALADPEHYAVSFGLSTTLFGIRGLLGPMVGTLLYSSGGLSLRAIFVGIAAMQVLAGLLMLWFARYVRTRGMARTEGGRA